MNAAIKIAKRQNWDVDDAPINTSIWSNHSQTQAGLSVWDCRQPDTQNTQELAKN